METGHQKLELFVHLVTLVVGNTFTATLRFEERRITIRSRQMCRVNRLYGDHAIEVTQSNTTEVSHELNLI